MTNLPIARHSPQPPARGMPGGAPLPRIDPSSSPGGNANTSQLNTSANEQLPRGSQHSGIAAVGDADSTQSKGASGLSAAGIVEPFSELLARQIVEVDSRGQVTAQDTSANGSDAATADELLNAKETPDQTGVATNTSGDAAGILTAMLQQIPAAEITGQRSKDSGNTPPINGSGDVRQMPGNNLQQAIGRLPPADSPFTGIGDSPQTVPAGFIALSTEVIEHAEMTANAPPQTGTNQVVTPSALTGVMPNMQGYNSTTTLSITTPLGSTGWAEEFTQKISWMSTQQYQLAELHLNPPDLGPVDVVLKISGNQVTALFSSPHSAVRDAMENALPKLREILADNGIMLGNATVSDHSPRDRSADGQLNQGFGAAAQRAIFGDESNAIGSAPAISSNIPARRHNGMVDTFA